MASIRIRGKKFIVRYRGFKDGKYKGIEESFETQEEALIRKMEIERKENNSIIKGIKTPTISMQKSKKNGKLTIEDLLNDFVRIYGKRNWNPSTYNDKVGRIKNYILPYIGNLNVCDATPESMDEYYSNLEKVSVVPGNLQKQKNIFVSPRIVKECHIILNGAFKLALKYGKVEYNPVNNPILPKCKKAKKRQIWDLDTFKKVINTDTLDLMYYNILNVGVTATTRIGEVTGLLWKNVHITEDLITKDKAYIDIITELARYDKDTMKISKNREIIFTFPNLKPNSKTTVVLTVPKTDYSIRHVFLPKTLALSLKKQFDMQIRLKELKGEKYQDYGLVFAQENGRPIEYKEINKMLKEICLSNNLPLITSHSLRHLGSTLKLGVSKGDIKAVQADTGHSRGSTLIDIYAHTFENTRIENTHKLDRLLYGSQSNPDLEDIIKALSDNPKLLNQVKQLLSD